MVQVHLHAPEHHSMNPPLEPDLYAKSVVMLSAVLPREGVHPKLTTKIVNRLLDCSGGVVSLRASPLSNKTAQLVQSIRLISGLSGKFS